MVTCQIKFFACTGRSAAGARPPPVTLYMLDGHGRMLACILKTMIDRGMDPDDRSRYRFVVVDIDAAVDQWYAVARDEFARLTGDTRPIINTTQHRLA